MILKSSIFKNAASKVGLEQAEEEGISGDLFRVCEKISTNICAELNNSKAFSFGEDVKQVSNISSEVVTIKPYTEEELTLIAEVPTYVEPYTPEQEANIAKYNALMADNNRITDMVIPIKPPVIPGYRLVSYRDLIMDETDDAVYAYNTKNDSAELVFKKVLSSFKMLYCIPISVDTEAYGYILIPANYESFFTSKLAVGLAYYFQFHETAKILEIETTRLGNMVADNNTVKRPILNNSIQKLNKYRL